MSSEAETRQILIDSQLEKSGWSCLRENLLREFLLADLLSKTGEEQGPEVDQANREYNQLKDIARRFIPNRLPILKNLPQSQPRY
jgi:hypothetical protein